MVRKNAESHYQSHNGKQTTEQTLEQGTKQTGHQTNTSRHSGKLGKYLPIDLRIAQTFHTAPRPPRPQRHTAGHLIAEERVNQRSLLTKSPPLTRLKLLTPSAAQVKRFDRMASNAQEPRREPVGRVSAVAGGSRRPWQVVYTPSPPQLGSDERRAKGGSGRQRLRGRREGRLRALPRRSCQPPPERSLQNRRLHRLTGSPCTA